MNDHRAELERLGKVGRFHIAAHRLDGPGTFTLRDTEVVPIASMFKVLLALEVAQAFHEGRLSPDQEVRVGSDRHCPGGLGLNQFSRPVSVSLYDVLYLSLAWSDNTATDLLLGYVDLQALHRRARLLGLDTVVITGDCRRLLRAAGEDLGYASEAEAIAGDWTPQADAADFTLDRTTRAAVNDLARLAGLIDAGAAANPEACGIVRELMSRQIWTTRLASTFRQPDWALYSKTGTLSPWRGEMGVVTRADGASVALAIAVRQHRARTPEAVVEAAVAEAAAVAVGLVLERGRPEQRDSVL